MVDRAADAGYPGAHRLWDMTLREIDWALRAFAAARQREAENIDLLAWLAGRYAAFAVHAPKRYPKRPDGISRADRPMTDAEMKQVFMALAGRDFE